MITMDNGKKKAPQRGDQPARLELLAGSVRNIFDLCHLIADLELLNHLTPTQRETMTTRGENIVTHTHSVMDRELEGLGHVRSKAA